MFIMIIQKHTLFNKNQILPLYDNYQFKPLYLIYYC
jgi:hypothetical protein